MKHILVSRRESQKQFSKREMREVQDEINSLINDFWRKRRFREEETATLDLQALKDEQSQIDGLVEQPVQAKIIPA